MKKKTKYKVKNFQEKNLHQEIGALSNIFCGRNQALRPLMVSFVELGYGCRSSAQWNNLRLKYSRFFHQFSNAFHECRARVEYFLIDFQFDARIGSFWFG